MSDLGKIYPRFLTATGISTDSRKIEEGCVFFALKGENFNGNKYAADAIRQGASFAIIDEKEYESSDQTILVDNVLLCLQQLALYHRRQLGIPILGITGTNGKTTTKELIAAVLAKKFKVSFTQGNLNNHIGVPLTLLRMNGKTEFGVVEMGANHPGEIADLCQIADPDYGIITNIGKAHLEGFGSFEGVIKTKSELYEYLHAKNGTVFYNNDNKLLEKIGADLRHRISYGTCEADFKGEPVQSPPYIHVKANFAKGVLYLNSRLIGDYNFENIMAAACIGNYFEVDPLKIQEAIKEYIPSNNRSQLIQKNNLNIVMDAYNANPTSMRAAILSFTSNVQDEKFMILGDMLELGEYAQQEHRNILELIHEKGFKNVLLVGKQFMAIKNDFHYSAFENVGELCSYLQENPIKNGTLLIKGSRGIQLEKALQYLS